MTNVAPSSRPDSAPSVEVERAAKQASLESQQSLQDLALKMCGCCALRAAIQIIARAVTSTDIAESLTPAEREVAVAALRCAAVTLNEGGKQ